MDRPDGLDPSPPAAAIAAPGAEAVLDEGAAIPAADAMGTAGAAGATLAVGAGIIMPEEITGADFSDRTRSGDSRAAGMAGI